MKELFLEHLEENNRISEAVEFFGYPEELVRIMFKYSKEYYENVWRHFYPDLVQEYYAAGFYTIRQLSYSRDMLFSNADVMNFVNIVEGSCLDYACGVGDYIIMLAKKGIRCVAIEHYGIPTEFLKYRFKRYNVNVEITSLVHAGVTDFTMLCSALDHVSNPIGIAQMICSITKRRILALPCIDETYDRPAHDKIILKDIPKAFDIINKHNASKG